MWLPSAFMRLNGGRHGGVRGQEERTNGWLVCRTNRPSGNTAGLVATRARGHTGGRRPKLSTAPQQLAAAIAKGGIPSTAIASTLGCSRHTAYKALAWAPV